MTHHPELPKSWYTDPVWVAGNDSFHWQGSVYLQQGHIKGVPAVYTPEGALHVGLTNRPDWKALEQSGKPCIIVDLPPGVPCQERKFWKIQKRHTRQLNWTDNNENQILTLPSNRLKQLRRGNRNALRLQMVSDPERIISLHLSARKRKNLHANEAALRQQLTSILSSPNQTSCIVQNEDGNDIASAVFLHEQGRTIYAFGGQLRSRNSALASVMLIAEGIRSAQEMGNTCFDFGGSMDPGVDKFYAEFGALAVPKLRCIRMARWVMPWLKIMRPDLFRELR